MTSSLVRASNSKDFAGSNVRHKIVDVSAILTFVASGGLAAFADPLGKLFPAHGTEIVQSVSLITAAGAGLIRVIGNPTPPSAATSPKPQVAPIAEPKVTKVLPLFTFTNEDPMFWQIASVFLSLVASVVGEIAAKVPFSTPPVFVTISGTKWGVVTTWTPTTPPPTV